MTSTTSPSTAIVTLFGVTCLTELGAPGDGAGGQQGRRATGVEAHLLDRLTRDGGHVGRHRVRTPDPLAGGRRRDRRGRLRVVHEDAHRGAARDVAGVEEVDLD